jgi:predicted HicB family RNase H-like nuclease
MATIDQEIAKEMENLNTDKMKIFKYVVDFVDDLSTLHEKNRALTLYNKLLSSILTSNDKVKERGIDNVVSGFKTFLLYHRGNILSDTLERIQRGEIIRYNNSETIYIDIQRFIYKADDDTKLAIRRHLLNIASVLDPEAKSVLQECKSSKEKVDIVLESVNDGTEEGKLICDMVTKVSNSMENSQSSNPGAAIMELFTSGTFSKMAADLESGKLNPEKLLSNLQNSMGKIA